MIRDGQHFGLYHITLLGTLFAAVLIADGRFLVNFAESVSTSAAFDQNRNRDRLHLSRAGVGVGLKDVIL
jgi:hypothetical protein